MTFDKIDACKTTKNHKTTGFAGISGCMVTISKGENENHMLICVICSSTRNYMYLSYKGITSKTLHSLDNNMKYEKYSSII